MASVIAPAIGKRLPAMMKVSTPTGRTLNVEPTPGDVVFRSGESSYVVANAKSDLDRRMLQRLTRYLRATLGKDAVITKTVSEVPPSRPFILVAYSSEASAQGIDIPDGSSESFVLATGQCSGRPTTAAIAHTDLGLKRAVQRIIISSRQRRDGLEIPEARLSERPWIPEREYALCPWVPRYVRGVFVNPYADERLNVWEYSDAQISAYTDMYDWFGFSGIQLMETSYSYSVFGSVDAFQSRLKRFAASARRCGQHVSLWVWAAEFSHFNWSDPDITYTPTNGKTAFEDPKVRKGFEKYYDYYAEMAPFVDRLIGHFYDPGNLKHHSDVFSYMKLLEHKFRAKNPRVEMAIDMWAASDPQTYFSELVKNGFKNYLILEPPHWMTAGQRIAIHQEAKERGLRMGLWGWYSTGYETDQLPSMYVNCNVLKKYYQGIKAGAATIYPYEYWSEMEAHHLNNIYSEYVAAQLLWNPDLDPHAILRELTDGIWGPTNGQKIYQALRLIEDVRSGTAWDTYWWTEPHYRLGTKDPSSDHQRAADSIRALEKITVDAGFVPKFPLPFPPSTFVELMLPQLRQILAFAQFRMDLARVQRSIKEGAEKQQIAQQLTAIWKPIPEYTTWVGTFGQIERRMQEILIRKVAADSGVELASPGWLRSQEEHRLLEEIQNVQRGKRGRWEFSSHDVREFNWSDSKLQARLRGLMASGRIEKRLDNGSYFLTDWDNYAA